MSAQSARTFADMTPDEINQCRGMWCDCDDDDGTIHRYVFHGMRGKHAIFTTPRTVQGGGGPGWTLPVFAHLITPRFDLPRAWNSDGTPVVADPEEYGVEAAGFVQLADGGGAQRTPFPPGTTVRRWVSDWEEIE